MEFHPDFQKVTHRGKLIYDSGQKTVVLVWQEGDWWVTPHGSKWNRFTGSPHPDSDTTLIFDTLSVEPFGE